MIYPNVNYDMKNLLKNYPNLYSSTAYNFDFHCKYSAITFTKEGIPARIMNNSSRPITKVKVRFRNNCHGSIFKNSEDMIYGTQVPICNNYCEKFPDFSHTIFYRNKIPINDYDLVRCQLDYLNDKK